MPENDLDLLTRAAREAGGIARRYWRKHPKTWDKPGHQGPVSEADLAIDEMLREMLLEARPDHAWLSEETDDSPERLKARRLFIVDPLDGTRSFLKGERTFAHSLAVIHDGAVTAGVVLLPMLDKLYAAALGQGAALNGAPIRAGGRDALDGADMLVARPALEPAHWAGPVPQVHRHLRPSLAYRMCLVAEGRYDAMLTIRDSWDWDTAAGALILTEAGARVTDRTGRPFAFNTPLPMSPGVIAANPALHAGILARLA